MVACSTAGPALITTDPLLVRNVAAVKVPPLVALMLPDWPRVPVVAINVAGPLVTVITPATVLSRLVCPVRLAPVTALTEPACVSAPTVATKVAMPVAALRMPFCANVPAVMVTLFAVTALAALPATVSSPASRVRRLRSPAVTVKWVKVPIAFSEPARFADPPAILPLLSRVPAVIVPAAAWVTPPAVVVRSTVPAVLSVFVALSTIEPAFRVMLLAPTEPVAVTVPVSFSRKLPALTAKFPSVPIVLVALNRLAVPVGAACPVRVPAMIVPALPAWLTPPPKAVRRISPELVAFSVPVAVSTMPPVCAINWIAMLAAMTPGTVMVLALISTRAPVTGPVTVTAPVPPVSARLNAPLPTPKAANVPTLLPLWLNATDPAAAVPVRVSTDNEPAVWVIEPRLASTSVSALPVTVAAPSSEMPAAVMVGLASRPV